MAGVRRHAVTVAVTITVAATPERVWRALCDPAEVAVWDGAQPVAVPRGYPQAGQHARWRLPVAAGFGLPLHDRVLDVDPHRRLRARITTGFVDLDETYTLEAQGDGRTRLTSTNEVRSRVPGLRWLAARQTAATVTAALGRLREHCGPGHCGPEHCGAGGR